MERIFFERKLYEQILGTNSDIEKKKFSAECTYGCTVINEVLYFWIEGIEER